MKDNHDSKKFKDMDVFLWILFSVISVYVLSLLFVFYFGFINSIKSITDFFRGNVFGVPREGILYGWKFSNYIDIFTDFYVQVKPLGEAPRNIYLAEMLGNSLIYSIMMSLFTIGTQVMVAYAVAKYDFKLKGVLYNVAILVMLIPIVGSLASEVEIATALGLKNSVLGVCIIRCKYPGLYFLVFYAAFKNVSWTYAEAAQLDGAGHWRIFTTLMLPMLTNTLVAVFILQFITNFNDYYTPMIFTPNNPTMAYGLYTFKFNSQAEPTKIIAATMFTCIPMLTIFLIFRNKIMGNVNIGGIKG